MFVRINYYYVHFRKTSIDDIKRINLESPQAEQVFDLFSFGLPTFTNEQIDGSLAQYNNNRYTKEQNYQSYVIRNHEYFGREGPLCDYIKHKISLLQTCLIGSSNQMVITGYIDSSFVVIGFNPDMTINQELSQKIYEVIMKVQNN